jgi:hypothetical protein
LAAEKARILKQLEAEPGLEFWLRASPTSGAHILAGPKQEPIADFSYIFSRENSEEIPHTHTHTHKMSGKIKIFLEKNLKHCLPNKFHAKNTFRGKKMYKKIAPDCKAEAVSPQAQN